MITRQADLSPAVTPPEVGRIEMLMSAQSRIIPNISHPCQNPKLILKITNKERLIAAMSGRFCAKEECRAIL